MVEIKDVREMVLLVIVGRKIALFCRTIGRRALAWVVNPTYQIIVVPLFTDAAQVGAEPPALSVCAFAHRVAAHTPARLEALFASGGVAGRLGWRLGIERTLPDESPDGTHIIIRQPEARHASARPESVGVLDPDRNPLRPELCTHFLEVRPHLLAVHLQVLDAPVELIRLQVDIGN